MSNLGQVFTPDKIVKKILNLLSYKDNCINKIVLEPSFGEGAFLMPIIEILINECLDKKMSNTEIVRQLENNIYGIEIDSNLFNKTKTNIDILLNKYNLKANLHLYNMDALDFKENIKFDYVIGNPPYVRIHKLDNITRNKIKKFNFSKGNTDLYIVFYELGINLLNDTGKLGYIAPNSYLKNTSQRNFRNYLLENNLITTIIDYKSNKIFKDADTYTAITIIDKTNNKKQLTYIDDKPKTIDYSLLMDNPWIFDENNGTNKLSDICNAQHGIATNADKIFISKIKEKTKTTVLFNDCEIEKDILIKIIKGSKYNGKTIDTYLLFPYKLKDGKYIALEEDELKDKYPLAYGYLLNNKKSLSERSLENNTKWYQFARSQSINTINKEKIVIKHVFPDNIDKIEYYIIPPFVAIYSGVYITTENKEKVEEILKSKEFLDYCKVAGKDMSGNYKAITAKTIKNYKY